MLYSQFRTQNRQPTPDGRGASATFSSAMGGATPSLLLSVVRFRSTQPPTTPFNEIDKTN